jgi:capsid protein
LTARQIGNIYKFFISSGKPNFSTGGFEHSLLRALAAANLLSYFQALEIAR